MEYAESKPNTQAERGVSERHAQVTAGDLAFLRALYSIDLETPLDLEQSSLESNMMKQFEAHYPEVPTF